MKKKNVLEAVIIELRKMEPPKAEDIKEIADSIKFDDPMQAMKMMQNIEALTVVTKVAMVQSMLTMMGGELGVDVVGPGDDMPDSIKEIIEKKVKEKVDELMN